MAGRSWCLNSSVSHLLRIQWVEPVQRAACRNSGLSLSDDLHTPFELAGSITADKRAPSAPAVPIAVAAVHVPIGAARATAA